MIRLPFAKYTQIYIYFVISCCFPCCHPLFQNLGRFAVLHAFEWQNRF